MGGWVGSGWKQEGARLDPQRVERAETGCRPPPLAPVCLSACLPIRPCVSAGSSALTLCRRNSPFPCCAEHEPAPTSGFTSPADTNHSTQPGGMADERLIDAEIRALRTDAHTAPPSLSRLVNAAVSSQAGRVYPGRPGSQQRRSIPSAALPSSDLRHRDNCCCLSDRQKKTVCL